MMRRRDLLLGGAALVLAGAARASTPANILVLVELQGGNDGLNTVVPYADPRYGALRPRLALAREQVIQLDEQLGFNPALRALLPAWEARELAVVCGVGYPEPNFSHFRSIEIWDTGSASRETLASGWIARALRALPGAADSATAAMALGRPHLGPLDAWTRAVYMESPGGLAQAARSLAAANGSGGGALGHVLAVQRTLVEAAGAIEAGLRRTPAPETRFPATAIGWQLNHAARLIAGGLDVRVVKASLGTFDTHVHQRNAHNALLGQLAEALAAFRTALMASGAWPRTAVLTYSEFGRRPAENAGQGTDHGTSSPLLVLGGRVKGGLHGRQPALADLVNSNLHHHVDFRSVYAAALRDWWAVDPRPIFGRDLPRLELFG